MGFIAIGKWSFSMVHTYSAIQSYIMQLKKPATWVTREFVKYLRTDRCKARILVHKRSEWHKWCNLIPHSIVTSAIQSSNSTFMLIRSLLVRGRNLSSSSIFIQFFHKGKYNCLPLTISGKFLIATSNKTMQYVDWMKIGTSSPCNANLQYSFTLKQFRKQHDLTTGRDHRALNLGREVQHRRLFG